MMEHLSWHGSLLGTDFLVVIRNITKKSFSTTITVDKENFQSESSSILCFLLLAFSAVCSLSTDAL